jgi:hypothetical protein
LFKKNDHDLVFFLQQKAKTKLMNEEMIFGSKPSTPVKRRFQPTTTPSKTPKYRKVKPKNACFVVNVIAY